MLRRPAEDVCFRLFVCHVSRNVAERQSLYWNKHGFRGRVYEEIVRLYDIRLHYPESIILEYNLVDPHAITVT